MAEKVGWGCCFGQNQELAALESPVSATSPRVSQSFLLLLSQPLVSPSLLLDVSQPPEAAALSPVLSHPPLSAAP